MSKAGARGSNSRPMLGKRQAGRLYRMRRIPIEERFWIKVDKTKGPNACWEWKASRMPTGYGHVSLNLGNGIHRSTYAHRVSYELTHGQIPDGMCVCHSCDNPACVNPSHLWLGTVADNIRDRDRKGRGKISFVKPPKVLKTLECPVCGNAFTRSEGEIEYRKRSGQNNFFCSLRCSGINRRIRSG